MTVADVPLGLQLSTQAGWNQLEADWLRMLSLDTHGFVAEHDGLPVGTTVVVQLGSVAWIAMVLVEEQHRGHGIGRKLVQTALKHLDDAGVRTVRLDATPVGQGLYETLGFRSQFELQRWEGSPVKSGPRPATTLGRSTGLRLSAPQFDVVCQLDQQVVRANRRRLLQRLMDDNPSSLELAVVKGRIEGYGMTRPGARATFVGPCVAERFAGAELLHWLLNKSLGSPACVDIPRANRMAEKVALSRGLTIQRPLRRMIRGDEVIEDLERLWASSGPELG